MTKKPAYKLPGLLEGMTYVPSHRTDIRVTFARVRRQIAQQQEQQEQVLKVIRVVPK